MPSFIDAAQKLAVWALPLILTFTVHPMAAGYAARALGDRTGEASGALSPNPLRYIDPLGTLVVPLLLVLTGGFLIGWGKPVPINARNFRHPMKDLALVALAGPGANLAMAIGWCALLKILTLNATQASGIAQGFIVMSGAGVLVNCAFIALNMLPLPPLAMGRVLQASLPPRAAWQLSKLEPYSFVIWIVLAVSGLLGAFLRPLMMWLYETLMQVFAIQ
jgi:Zn-dependent protease